MNWFFEMSRIRLSRQKNIPMDIPVIYQCDNIQLLSCRPDPWISERAASAPTQAFWAPRFDFNTHSSCASRPFKDISCQNLPKQVRKFKDLQSKHLSAETRRLGLVGISRFLEVEYCPTDIYFHQARGIERSR